MDPSETYSEPSQTSKVEYFARILGSVMDYKNWVMNTPLPMKHV